MSKLFDDWHDSTYPDETRIANKFIREEAFDAGMEPFLQLIHEMNVYLDTNKMTNIMSDSPFHRKIKMLLEENV